MTNNLLKNTPSWITTKENLATTSTAQAATMASVQTTVNLDSVKKFILPSANLR
jgi:hypothetical protein